jgi:GAF domain-containing protein
MDTHPDKPLQPQDAFEQLGLIKFADASLDDVLEKIAALTKRTVPGASEVSVTLVERGRPSTVASTGTRATSMDERQYDRGHGPCLDCLEGGEPVRITDMNAETRWPDWAAEAHRHGVGSSLSIPVPVQREVTAALNIYSTQHDAFGDADLEIAMTFAAYAGVALANMHLYQAHSRLAEDLQTAMKSRAIIEQAKGILMGTRHCTADEAFDLLIRQSQAANRKLRDVAQALVDAAVPDADR